MATDLLILQDGVVDQHQAFYSQETQEANYSQAQEATEARCEVRMGNYC